ncbi:hypothetical protein GCM10010082_09550 [Kushneria pakistanensis]|uniref:Uncharacterized protein n=1 Tax=Kushneria pakistanensis TaxID=1508770 RepID=A0ABQ3FDN3_9GAMM|nr:hypothetical protein GCM10010082_09550 [Kushneria pakistanensis]
MFGQIALWRPADAMTNAVMGQKRRCNPKLKGMLYTGSGQQWMQALLFCLPLPLAMGCLPVTLSGKELFTQRCLICVVI